MFAYNIIYVYSMYTCNTCTLLCSYNHNTKLILSHIAIWVIYYYNVSVVIRVISDSGIPCKITLETLKGIM